jgi:hypothetical protein
MKQYFVFCLVLLLAGILAAGCTTTSPVTQTPVTGTPAATPATATATASSVSAQPTLALGDHYLQKSYSFHNTNDKYTEQVRIDNSSWAVVYTVTPLSDDVQTGWFEITVTNVDSKKSQTFGYGRTYAYDTYQQYPMYSAGSYEIDMKGNLTKIDLDVAKRLP